MSIRDNMIQQVLGNPGKYSIQQLQQAMQDGSLPAYVVVPIIQDKVQQQKQMQTAMAMQQQLPQTTIAEQVMQEAAQIDGGVEQLPSNLPQEYAQGGIVAFDEGGEVERYQGGGYLRAKALFQDLMREEQLQQQIDRIKRARDAAKAAAEAARTASPAAAEGVAGAGAAAAETTAGAAKAASGPSRFQAIRQALQPSGWANPNIPTPSGAGSGISSALKGGARLAGKLVLPYTAYDYATSAMDLANTDTDILEEYYGRQLAPGEEPSFMRDVTTRARGALGLLNPFGSDREGIAALVAKRRSEEAAAAEKDATAAKEKQAADAARAREAMGAGGPGAGGPGAGGPGAGSATLGNIFEQLRAAQEGFTGKKTAREEVEPLLKDYLEKADKTEAARKKEADRLRGQVTGQAYEGLEADMRKEAEELGADKEQAKAMAIFKAGLAMMGGTSRHALENIGKGAMVGAEDYQKAAADIKKAQKENRLMMAHIENARRAEKRGDIEKQVDELDKASSREDARNQFYATGLSNAGVKDIEMRRQLGQNLTTVAGSIYSHQLAADARKFLADTRSQGRGAFTEAQLAKVTSDALKEIGSRDMFYRKMMKEKKLSGTPSDQLKAIFDKQYDDAVNKRIQDTLRLIPGRGATPSSAYAGFSDVNPEE